MVVGKTKYDDDYVDLIVKTMDRAVTGRVGGKPESGRNAKNV